MGKHWFTAQLRKKCRCEEKFCKHLYLCTTCGKHITHDIHLQWKKQEVEKENENAGSS